MPTKNPILQVVIDEKTLNEFKTICEKEGRSASNLAKKLITDYIQTYNQETIHSLPINSKIS